jgi:hypothetical protein
MKMLVDNAKASGRMNAFTLIVSRYFLIKEKGALCPLFPKRAINGYLSLICPQFHAGAWTE